MSQRGSTGSTEQLQGELRSLKEILGELTARVAELSMRVEESDLNSQRSLGSFEVCGNSEAEQTSASTSVVAPAASYPKIPAQLPIAFQATAAEPDLVGVQSWEERDAIAVLVGQFLARALAGDHRGNSGRHQIRAASQLYLVVRDFRGGVTTNPANLPVQRILGQLNLRRLAIRTRRKDLCGSGWIRLAILQIDRWEKRQK